MKILLDEDLPHKLRTHLPGHDVYTVAFMGWGGLKNGQLLTTAERGGFDILITGDQAMPDEQNLSGRGLAVLALSAIEWPILKNHLAAIALAVRSATPGMVTRVQCGVFSRRRSNERLQ